MDCLLPCVLFFFSLPCWRPMSAHVVCFAVGLHVSPQKVCMQRHGKKSIEYNCIKLCALLQNSTEKKLIVEKNISDDRKKYVYCQNVNEGGHRGLTLKGRNALQSHRLPTTKSVFQINNEKLRRLSFSFVTVHNGWHSGNLGYWDFAVSAGWSVVLIWNNMPDTIQARLLCLPNSPSM